MQVHLNVMICTKIKTGSLKTYIMLAENYVISKFASLIKVRDDKRSVEVHRVLKLELLFLSEIKPLQWIILTLQGQTHGAISFFRFNFKGRK